MEAPLCDIFHVSDVHAVQDILNCILLSESVYRAHETGPKAVAAAFNTSSKSFVPGLITITQLQCSLPHVQHRYVLGTSHDAMYVAFMGTKAMRDVLSDVNYVQTALWPGLLEHSSEVPTAHQGFLARSESVQVELLYMHASQQNKRLVLCGHSLGGAVAQLCALRLLRDLPPVLAAQGRVKCVSFAAPPLGNSALANTVARKGWNGLFYNLALPEDVVPRLMAMRSSVGLPAAAAEAMLSEASEPGDEHENQRSLYEGDAPRESAESSSETVSERPGSSGGQQWVESPQQERDIHASADGQTMSTSQQSLGSPAQAWRARLRSSLERLRAVTADLGAREPSNSNSRAMPSSAAAAEQHATQQRFLHPGDERAVPGISYMGRAKLLSSTAARYLPIYVHIGSQHQLHAPPGEPPLRPESLQNSAEDAETVVALAEQDAVPGAALEQQRAPGNKGYSGLGVPAYRSYLNVLTYHRMFAIRRRAAALCAAAVGRDWLTSRREPAHPAELCENIAPRLEVAAVSGRVPPSRPQPPMPAPAHLGRPHSSRWANAQWASTLSALTSLIPGRQTARGDDKASSSFGSIGMAQSWWPWHGSVAGPAPSGHNPPSEAGSASGPPHGEENGVGQHVKAAGSTAYPWQAVPSFARWLWRPWDTGGAHPDSADTVAAGTEPGNKDVQQRPQRWLGWAGAGRRPDERDSTAAMPLRITVRGRGLASCTKGRVLAPGGAVCPARIITAPQISMMGDGAHTGSPAKDQSGEDATGVAQRGGLWDMGRRFGRSVRHRLVGQQPNNSTAQMGDFPEELIVETVLPPAVASAVERGLAAQQDGRAGHVKCLLEAQLRSDFFVRRVNVALQPCTAWILSNSAQGADILMDGLCAPPGSAVQAAAPPFRTALAGNVRIISLWPDTPRAAALPAMAGLVGRHLRSTAEGLKGTPAEHERLQHSKAIPTHEPPAQAARQQAPEVAGQANGGHQPAALPLGKLVNPAARGLRWAASAAASVIGTEASSKVAAWTARASEGAGSIMAGVGTQVRLLQHGLVWRALKLQPSPDLLIVCLKKPATHSSRWQVRRFFGLIGRGSTGDSGQTVPEHGSADSLEATMGMSAREWESVRVLQEVARTSHIPVLLVVLPSSSGGQESWERRSHLPVGLQAASRDVLVLHESTDQLGGSDAWRLKVAVYHALTSAMQPPPLLRSKL
ncbi:probable protein EDS1L at N-terminal half [Coccomyxa sp. Obi]|nr:probable protein EDS1L at N-terminal half [Coccomyxa sp. Obi]